MSDRQISVLTEAYKALLNANLRVGDWVVIPGAGGGLGHLAVQYALAMNYRVCCIDAGEEKRAMLLGYGAHAFVDFSKETVIFVFWHIARN